MIAGSCHACGRPLAKVKQLGTDTTPKFEDEQFLTLDLDTTVEQYQVRGELFQALPACHPLGKYGNGLVCSYRCAYVLLMRVARSVGARDLLGLLPAPAEPVRATTTNQVVEKGTSDWLTSMAFQHRRVLGECVVPPATLPMFSSYERRTCRVCNRSRVVSRGSLLCRPCHTDRGYFHGDRRDRLRAKFVSMTEHLWAFVDLALKSSEAGRVRSCVGWHANLARFYAHGAHPWQTVANVYLPAPPAREAREWAIAQLEVHVHTEGDLYVTVEVDGQAFENWSVAWRDVDAPPVEFTRVVRAYPEPRF